MSQRPLNKERRLEILIGSIRDYAIFMLDADGRIQTWNAGARAIKGYTAEEIIGRSIETFYTDEDRAAGLPKQLLGIARAEGRVEAEGWRVRKDGTKFYADVVITALRDDDGSLVGYVKVTRDLTERRQAEQERLRLAQAHEAIRMRDEFLSIASHELRTPLMALQLQIESVQRLLSGTNEKVEQKLVRADRSVRRLSDLVETLLDVTRITTGKLTLHAQPDVDLSEIVTEVVDRMQEPAAAAGCKLAQHIEAGIIGNWDVLRMGQVVTNLLSNSVRYASGSSIDVVLRRDGERVHLTVSDTGPGIPIEDLGRIFERFERAADSRHHGGLGLGLYVTREIVLAHGGTISVANRETGGVTFAIDLPAKGASI